MKDFFNKYKWDIFIILMLVILGSFQVLMNKGPGLYYDAVNPDNLAMKALKGSLRWNYFPFLGQIYHGTITIWFQMLIILITGITNVYTLRFANIFYVVMILIAFYLIGKKFNLNKYILGLFVLVVILSPQVFLFIRTQYYIKLPGTMLIFWSLFFIIENEKRLNHKVWVLISGILAGLAFYSYFIYLFYFPGLLFVFCYYTKKNNYNFIKDIIVYISGYVGGILFYILGYLNIFVSSFSYPAETITSIFKYTMIIVILIYSIVLIYIIKKYNSKNMPKIILSSSGICFIVGLFILYLKRNFIIGVMKPLVNVINVGGSSITFIDRIKQLFNLAIKNIQNISLENQVLGKHVGLLPDMFIVVLLICSCILIFTIIRKKDLLKQYSNTFMLLFFLILLICSFSIFSIFFISRMGGQHFTSFTFIIFFIICIEIILLEKIFDNKIISTIIYGLLISILLLNSYNSYLISKEIHINGGYDYYTIEINNLADEAMKSETIDNDIYIFKDWGLYTGFNYLTQDKIDIESYDIERIVEFIESGKHVNIFVWKEDPENIEKDLLDKNIQFELKQYYDSKNNKLFLKLKCTSIIKEKKNVTKKNTSK